MGTLGRDVFSGASAGSAIEPGLGTAIGGGIGALANIFEDVPVLGDILDPFGIFGESSEMKKYKKYLKELKAVTEKYQKEFAEKGPQIEQARWDALQRASGMWDPYVKAIGERYGQQYVPNLEGVFQNPFQNINLGPTPSPSKNYKYNPVSSGVGREVKV